MLNVELESAVALGQHLEGLKAGCNDFGAYAVAGNGRNCVFAHV